MRSNKKRRIPVIALAMVTGALTLFAFIQATYVVIDYQENQRSTKAWAEQHTRKIAEDLSNKIAEISAIAEALAKQIGDVGCSPCDIDNNLRETYLQHTDFFALGLAFNVNESRTGLRLYAPFIRQNSDGAAIERLDNYYDYLAHPMINLAASSLADSSESLLKINTATENLDLRSNAELWYLIAYANERQWLGPFREAAYSRDIIRYTTPIHNSAGEKIGLVFVDISLGWLHEQIEKYDIKDNNYLVLQNANGEELYRSFKDMTQSFQRASNTDQQLGSTTTNELTDSAAWINSSVIATTQWKLISVIAKDTVIENNDNKNEARDQSNLSNHSNHSNQSNLSNQFNQFNQSRTLTKNDSVGWVSLLVLLAILYYSLWRLYRKRTSELQLWVDTAVYTLILMTGVICIWVLEYGAISEHKDKAVILANKAIIKKYESEYATRALAAHQDAPIYVPVGLFIQSIEFLSATNVNVTGYIWHRYQAGQDSDYKIGTVFPEAIETRINLAYEKTTNGETLKGWYFETTLRENFTPDRYPLDRQSIWIRLWHEKIGDNIVLIPDLKAYDNLDTRALPGIEKDFVLSGWDLFRSYFEMHEKKYDTQLGVTTNSSGVAVPELYFNIEIMRNFINPFLAHLFPLLVVVLMLYAIVMTMSTDQEKKDFLGFNAAGVVASCSALFFVALISHVQMRDELKANSVVYLEYFYLITYVIILLITANAVLLSLKVPLKFIHFHDNLLPKLLYWPAICGALFLCTLWEFRNVSPG